MSDPSATSDDLVKGHVSEILDANANWARRLNQTFPQYFPPSGKQKPKILWIGCSDSRAQDSDATVSLPGTVFVHRNIANQVHAHDDNALSVIAYSLGALEVQHVVVVGHEYCGGVDHALGSLRGLADEIKYHLTLHAELRHKCCHPDDVQDKQSNKPNDVIDRWLAPLVRRLQKLKDQGLLPKDPAEALKFAVRENVKLQVENLTKTSLEAFVKESTENKVWVHGWVYEFTTGFLEDLKITREIN